MSGSQNIIDNVDLNLSLDGYASELVSERNLYGFAQGLLAKTLDEVLDATNVNGNVLLDSLTIDLNVDGSGPVFENIAKALQNTLKSKLASAVFKAQSSPITDMLAEVYRRHLPAEKSSSIEHLFNDLAEQWKREHVGQEFKPLSLAESIILRMQQENPNIDVKQIAYIVYQNIMKINDAQKKQNKQPKIQTENSEKIYEVPDAGLVLLSPYIPALFQRTGCIAKDAFQSDDAKRKALSILKYVAYGNYAEPPGKSALMNLFCGLPVTPVLFADELPKIMDEEKELVEGLLKAVIANWSAVGHMSPDGLRGTYFVRGGKINMEGAADLLTVENKTFDILIDRLPWGFTVIKHPWMSKILNVKWR